MNQGTYPLAASMINQLNRVDMVANNLANARTAGFKQEGLSEGSFNYYMKKANEQKQDIDPLAKVLNTVPKIDTKYIDSSAGSIISSSNRLDFAIKSKDIYFKIKNNNGETLLTRDGTFNNIDGKLVTKNGFSVLNINNEPIVIGDNNEFATSIGLTKIDLSNIEKTGDNNYKILNQGNLTNLMDNEAHLTQGSIESSNVNSIKAMISLIEAQRSFEQAQKAVTGIDDLNSKVIDKVGSAR